MKTLALLCLTLAACSGPPFDGEACAPYEEASATCMVRISMAPPAFENRCYGACDRGVWRVKECLPSCGPGMLYIGEYSGECYIPTVACAVHR